MQHILDILTLKYLLFPERKQLISVQSVTSAAYEGINGSHESLGIPAETVSWGDVSWTPKTSDIHIYTQLNQSNGVLCYVSH